MDIQKSLEIGQPLTDVKEALHYLCNGLSYSLTTSCICGISKCEVEELKEKARRIYKTQAKSNKDVFLEQVNCLHFGKKSLIPFLWKPEGAVFVIEGYSKLGALTYAEGLLKAQKYGNDLVKTYGKLAATLHFRTHLKNFLSIHEDELGRPPRAGMLRSYVYGDSWSSYEGEDVPTNFGCQIEKTINQNNQSYEKPKQQSFNCRVTAYWNSQLDLPPVVKSVDIEQIIERLKTKKS